MSLTRFRGVTETKQRRDGEGHRGTAKFKSFWRGRDIHSHRPARSRSARHSRLHFRPHRRRREPEGRRLLSFRETVNLPARRSNSGRAALSPNRTAGNFTSRWSDRDRDRAVGVGPVPWLPCGARPGAQRRLAPGFVLAGQGAQRPARMRPLLA
jgi:hypothetical protein